MFFIFFVFDLFCLRNFEFLCFFMFNLFLAFVFVFGLFSGQSGRVKIKSDIYGFVWFVTFFL
jgi:hypothetical protein